MFSSMQAFSICSLVLHLILILSTIVKTLDTFGLIFCLRIETAFADSLYFSLVIIFFFSQAIVVLFLLALASSKDYLKDYLNWGDSLHAVM